MEDPLKNFAHIVIVEVLKSQRYWWSSTEARKHMKGPRFDRNQTVYLLKLFKDMGGELYGPKELA